MRLPPCLLPWYLRTTYGMQIIPYVQKTDWPLRMGRQIDLEKRPGRPGDDASPLGERVTTRRVILTGADATLAANRGRSPEGVNNS